MKRRLIAGVAIFATCGMVLAACGSSGGGSASQSSSAPETSSSQGSTSSGEQPPASSNGSGSSESSGTAVPNLGHATILTNWFAESSQGGYWAAQAEGLAAARGVDLEVKQGGPGIQTIPQVVAGQADFGVGNADEIMVAVSNGLPIVAVATGEAQNIQCLAYHKSTGIKSFADLNGKTVSRVPSPYWDFIKWKYKLDKVNEINIGSLANFQKDPNLVLQCFITQEPYEIDKMGMKDVGYLEVGKDAGYKSDLTMLFTTKKLAQEKPDLVRAVVQASNEGWAKMLADPTKTKDLIMKVNPDGDPAAFDYSIKVGKGRPELRVAPNYGIMSPERFKELKQQLVDIGLLKPDFDETKAYDMSFGQK